MPDPDATATLTTTTADTQRQLPDGWRWARLGDVCETQSGGTPSRGYSGYYGGDIAWAKIEDLTQSGMYIESTAECITVAGLNNSSAKLLPPGTVLLAMYGSIGAASIAECPITTNQAIIGCKCSVELLPEMLWYWLTHVKDMLVTQGRGGTQSNLNAEIVRNIPVPLPPLDEQRRIAAILAERMAAVERARAAAEAQLAAAKALPAAELRAIFESEEAQAWPRVRLGDVALFQNGRAFPSHEYSDLGTRLLRPGNLFPDGTVQWNATNTRHMPDHWANEFPDYVVAGRELVMNLTAQSLKDEFLGRICMTEPNESCLLNQRLARVTPRANLDRRYALYALKSPDFRRFVDGLNKGSLIQHMFTSQLAEFSIPLPAHSEQQHIAAQLDACMADIARLRASLEAQLDTINALPAALLRQAFSGEL